MTNKTTKQYQKGVEEFENKFGVIDKRWVDKDHTNRYRDQKTHIKQHTLSILQSEYDRLEREKPKGTGMININGVEVKVEMHTDIQVGYVQAITDQQDHILETINEIKGL